MFEANYTSGVRVFDISNINSITQIAYYDTHPENDGQTYDGAWGIYPLLPSGNILVSDIQRGLFVLNVTGVTAVPENLNPSGAIRFYRSRPNPFSSSTTYSFYLPSPGKARLRVYDIAGRLVTTLIDADLPAGPHQISWDGTDGRGSRLSNGVYLIHLKVKGKTFTQKSILLR